MMKSKDKERRTTSHKVPVCPGCGLPYCICDREKTSGFKKAKKARPKH